ncbi:hypothetical protein FHS85_001743 [Rhodoligotrophos appendicifer]|uniref:phage tail protein n=1 Tax=Rhodoligotrophos appendicifer TaxID=987056 RepID=UPI001186F82B|nr:phage tail protein [Rhodoligotrophos appendicifer]
MPPVIGAAIAGAIGLAAGTTAFAIVSYGISAAIGIGLSLGISALSGAFAKPKRPPGGGQVDLQTGGDVPRSIPLGRIGLKGHLLYWNTWDVENDKLELVHALGDFECEALIGIYVDGVSMALQAQPDDESGADAVYIVDGYDDRILLRFFAGRVDQAVNSALVANANPVGRWTANDRLSGICHVQVQMAYNRDIFVAGIPELLFELKGARLYDLRKDTTAGGSGSHRWADQSTWEWSENPAVMEYCYRRGFYRGSELVLGMGVPASDLIVDYYMAAANVCDETVTEGGGTAKRYVCAAIVTADVEHRTAIEAFTHAMAGYSYEKAGSFGPIAGAAQASVATITEDHLANGYAAKWRGKRSRVELLNAVFGSYTDPDNQWGMSAYPPVTDPTWQAQDGNERIATQFDLPSVPSPYQANRVAEIRARETRMQATGEITVGLQWIYLEPGDWITYTNRAGGRRTYRVARKTENEDRTITLEIGETGSWVYGIGSPPTSVPVTVPPSTPGLLTNVQNVQLQAETIEGADGQMRPALHVTWTPPTDQAIDAVIIEYRIAGQPATMTHRDDTPDDSEAWITQDVLAGTDYEIRATITTTPSRVTSWTPWIAITTTTNYVVLDAVRAAEAIGELRDEIDEITASIGSNDAVGEYATQLRREILDDMEADILALVGDYQGDLTASKDRRKAEFGLLQEVSLQFVRIGQNEASILAESLARADSESAFASALEVVEANSAGGTASGQLYWEAVSGPAGVTARYSAFVKVEGGGEAEEAGLYMEVVPDGEGGFASRIGVSADSFFVYQNDGLGSPNVVFLVGTVNGMTSVGINGQLIVDGTINTSKLNAASLSAISANLGTVTAGKIQSPDGKFVIDCTNKLIRIEV